MNIQIYFICTVYCLFVFVMITCYGMVVFIIITCVCSDLGLQVMVQHQYSLEH